MNRIAVHAVDMLLVAGSLFAGDNPKKYIV